MSKPRGQGLIEAIVALAVIITGIGGSISLASYSLRGSDNSMNRLVALELSWEGIETAVNIRDSNHLAGVAFNVGLVSGSDTTAIASFDPATGAFTMDFGPNTFGDNATILYQQGGLYRQASSGSLGSPTIFRRLLTLDNTVTDKIGVTSTVQWMEGSSLKSVVSQRVLYNIR